MALSDRQMIAITMLVYQGCKKIDVCRELKLTPMTLQRWTALPEFQEEYEKQLKHKISSIAAEAMEKIYKLMSSPNHTVALNAAKDIVSRAGFDAAVKQDIVFDGKMITIDYGPEEE